MIDNLAQLGGAVRNDGRWGTASPTIRNTILWGNASDADVDDTGSGDEIYNDSATPTLGHTIIEGGLSSIDENNGSSTTDDGGTLGRNPRFEYALLPAGDDGTADIGAYEVEPTLPSVAVDGATPTTAYPGHPVVLSGSGFFGVSSVTYNGTSVPFTVASVLELRARRHRTIGPGAGAWRRPARPVPTSRSTIPASRASWNPRTCAC